MSGKTPDAYGPEYQKWVRESARAVGVEGFEPSQVRLSDGTPMTVSLPDALDNTMAGRPANAPRTINGVPVPDGVNPSEVLSGIFAGLTEPQQPAGPANQGGAVAATGASPVDALDDWMNATNPYWVQQRDDANAYWTEQEQRVDEFFAARRAELASQYQLAPTETERAMLRDALNNIETQRTRARGQIRAEKKRFMKASKRTAKQMRRDQARDRQATARNYRQAARQTERAVNSDGGLGVPVSGAANLAPARVRDQQAAALDTLTRMAAIDRENVRRGRQDMREEAAAWAAQTNANAQMLSADAELAWQQQVNDRIAQERAARAAAFNQLIADEFAARQNAAQGRFASNDQFNALMGDRYEAGLEARSVAQQQGAAAGGLGSNAGRPLGTVDFAVGNFTPSDPALGPVIPGAAINFTLQNIADQIPSVEPSQRTAFVQQQLYELAGGNPQVFAELLAYVSPYLATIDTSYRGG